ncbi:NlpC/P60 family protein [Galbibacter pacificus]|uniref:NlpC/P60 family protein n=1 Tax=Galbibacter pacificus TaxID=2996052 RepID=A0ABT6FRL2_9FLAO|nr:NlpC/P60 family protein [Galbibacter pacificus]MDG3582966.1 NlpC/P60 family protein [Galbibacter pacificus]MDG3585915.1 NlpC/P60 family protein [Galbibacter pacificus]
MTIYNKKILLLLAGVVLSFVSCSTTTGKNDAPDAVETIITEVKNEYAPDKRVAIFNIETKKTKDGYVLKGSSNLPKAVNKFTKKLTEAKIHFTDSIEMLPAPSLEGKTQGVIKLSAANLRGNPKHSAELVTQGTLGMPVNIYKKEGSWYLVQTPDHYIAWVDYGGVEPMDKEAFAKWKAGKKLIYTKTSGNSHAEANEEAQVISDLVAGNILSLQGEKGNFYEVKYPDGRTAYVSKKEAAPYNEWVQSLEQTKEDLVSISKTLMGLPYLWGGTSPKGVDCSGFTKTVYFLNGMIIPRDASQQIHEGILVDDSKDFSKLQPGDLLFFGKKATDSTKERVIHVGMWIGNNEFIHSAGSVHISSMDKNASNYDEYNYNRYLRSKRILNEESKGLIDLKDKEVF